MGTIVCPWRREIPEALVQIGKYTEAQAQAIYHHWVAPMTYDRRLWFLSMVYNGEVAINTSLGLKVLVTSRGW